MSNDTQKPAIGHKTAQEVVNEGLVINQIVIRPVDRTTKDVGDWRNAHRSAENVYYPNRTRLYDLYEDVRLDGHLTGIINKRIDAVLNKSLHFYKNDKKVDELDDIIESDVFREIITKIMETKLYGISGLEFIPGKELCFEEIPRKHIKPEKKVIALEQSAITGIDYSGIDNIWIIGKSNDLGMLLKCAPYALWKRGDMADWAQYVEIFGQPVRIMKYDAYDLQTKMELQQVVDEAGSSLALLIPKQADFEMKDGKQSNGDGSLQDKLKEACNAEMSVIVLGNTETTTSSSSSGYAQSKEHSKQQIEVSKSDLKFVQNMLNSSKFLDILKSYGFPVDGGRFQHEKEADINTITQQLNVLAIVSKNVPVSDDQWYEASGVSKPDNYEELKAKQEAERKAITQGNIEDEPDEDEQKGPSNKPKSGNKGGGKKKLAAEVSMGWLNDFRIYLADFFGPAH